MNRNCEKYFFCYDSNLARFIRFKKDIDFITHAIHPKTHNEFWLFERSDELDSAITEYTSKINIVKTLI
jgi:hypothetical protein